MIYDTAGNRKYLTGAERKAFIVAARKALPEIETFCLTLTYTGARISEILALTPKSIDLASRAIIIESLKKRKRGVYRAVPVPDQLLARLEEVHDLRQAKDNESQAVPLWPWSRTTAWSRVKTLMRCAQIPSSLAMPKALRHAFGVGGTQASVPLNIVQKWMGHARLTTTAIYADALGEEERALAKRMWKASI